MKQSGRQFVEPNLGTHLNVVHRTSRGFRLRGFSGKEELTSFGEQSGFMNGV